MAQQRASNGAGSTARHVEQIVQAAERTAEELRAAAVQVPVVLDAEHVGQVREGVARFMTMNVVLWQALPLASKEHGVTRVVRDALVAVMSQVADVIEICLFKLDAPLATSLQQRLAAIPDEVAPTDNWREILADL